MGSCASTFHKNSKSSSAKVDQVSTEKSSMPPTPIKDKPTNVDPPILPLSQNSRFSNFNSVSSYRSFGGSKDEAFYDTQGWLESDCDDDFYSVNGDFTPSRGNTPVHAAGTPRLSRVFSPQVTRAVFEGKPQSRSAVNRSRGSPSVRRSFSSTIQGTEAFSNGSNSNSSSTTTATTKSKKLLDLFKESMRERGDVGLTFPSPDLPPKPANRTPSGLRYTVSSSDKALPVGDHMPVREKPAKFSHHCFPRLAYVRSLSASKKTSTPPMSTDDLRA